MKFGPCPKCGGGIYTSIIPKPVDLGPNYCFKCGASLWETCVACNGTGRKGGLLGIGVNKYCSECGRKLDTRCPSCNGRGKTRVPHFCL